MMSPCKDCPDRAIGCHGQCKRYKTFQEENAKRLAWEHGQTSLNWEQTKRELIRPMRMYLNNQKAKQSR